MTSWSFAVSFSSNILHFLHSRFPSLWSYCPTSVSLAFFILNPFSRPSSALKQVNSKAFTASCSYHTSPRLPPPIIFPLFYFPLLLFAFLFCKPTQFHCMSRQPALHVKMLPPTTDHPRNLLPASPCSPLSAEGKTHKRLSRALNWFVSHFL